MDTLGLRVPWDRANIIHKKELLVCFMMAFLTKHSEENGGLDWSFVALRVQKSAGDFKAVILRRSIEHLRGDHHCLSKFILLKKKNVESIRTQI